MTQTATLPALINAIREAHQTGNDAEASRLFQVLYATVRTHIWNAYSGVLFIKFQTNNTSLRAEIVYQKILNEVERDIRRGKFVIPAGVTDKDVRRLLIAWMCWKVVMRVLDAMEKWKKNPVHDEADLQFSALEDFACDGAPDPEEERIAQSRISVVFGKMIPRDADILRTRFYSELSKEEAERILMERYTLSESALEKAITRAKDRFRELWIAYLNSLETKPIPK